MLAAFAELKLREGAWAAPVAGVTLIQNSHSYPPAPAFYEPCMVLVAQGSKRFHFPDTTFTYDTRHFLLVTVPVPASCEVQVDAHGPFLGVAVRIDLQVLADILMHMSFPSLVADRSASTLTISAPPISVPLAAAGVRLLRAMLSSADAAVLGPPLVRELHYYALTGPAGGMLRGLLSGGASRLRVHRVLGRMHATYAAPFPIEQVAREAGLSVSAFHDHFRAVTGSSPLHYLKLLRLHRARTLMVQAEISAADACEQVGYVSQSQFSREFKRLFGQTPVREARRMRALLGISSG